MSRIEKLTKRLLSFPKDFTYNELKAMLLSFGYIEVQGTGSRICFSKDDHKIKLHKPHPGKILKAYQLKLVIDELIAKGIISKDNLYERN